MVETCTYRRRIKMDISKVFHMNAGVGHTSYTHNSLIQSKALSLTEDIKKEAVRKMYLNCFKVAGNISCVSIADLGCSSGPNTLLLVQQFITAVDVIRLELGHNQSLDFQILLNDLPENDFNTVFQSLPRFLTQLQRFGGQCFFNGVPGSFYRRLFPSESLHFVHSSYSLHWLSRVPVNLGRSNNGEIWLSSSSPEFVMKAYLQQFKADFSMFLKCRSEEMVRGGSMVFTLLGRENDAHFTKRDATYAWNLLSVALCQMVSEGSTEEEKLDLFNLPAYMPSAKEIRSEVEEEGSFSVNSIQISEVGWEDAAEKGEEGYKGQLGCMRAVGEPLLSVVFGGDLMEELFTRYAQILRQAMATERCVNVNLTVSLTRLQT